MQIELIVVTSVKYSVADQLNAFVLGSWVYKGSFKLTCITKMWLLECIRHLEYGLHFVLLNLQRPRKTIVLCICIGPLSSSSFSSKKGPLCVFKQKRQRWFLYSQIWVKLAVSD